MPEADGAGMQALTGTGGKTVIDELPVFCETGAAKDYVAAVSFIVEERMSNLFHVHPYLVGTPRFQLTLNE